MTPLDALESQSIYIIREAFNRIGRLAMLWSLGKDSNVMLWLARKAFFGRVPFPVVHVDTGRKFPEMYAFRARYAAEWGLDLVIGECPPAAAMDPTLPPAARAKERVFSPRLEGSRWDFRNQPPEFWDQFMTDLPPGGHLRIHPILHWTELDIWRYVRRESIPVVDLYFAKGGKRYRSLGDQDITAPVASEAATLDAIIAELEETRIAERSGRAMDHEAEDSFERLRADGYM